MKEAGAGEGVGAAKTEKVATAEKTVATPEGKPDGASESVKFGGIVREQY